MTPQSSRVIILLNVAATPRGVSNPLKTPRRFSCLFRYFKEFATSNRRLLRNFALCASLAVAAPTFGSAVVSVSSLRADEPQVAATQEFDKTLLAIPDVETTEFYPKRLEVWLAELRARPSFKPGQNALPVEVLSPEQSELAPAIATVLLKLADDASPSSSAFPFLRRAEARFFFAFVFLTLFTRLAPFPHLTHFAPFVQNRRRREKKFEKILRNAG